MEFDSHFAACQGILRSQERVHGKLQDIKQDDHVKVDEIKKKMLGALEDSSKGEVDLRRTFLLLLFNTEAEEYGCMVDDPNCGHIVGVLPKLSGYLFMQLVDHLNLNEFLFESILQLPMAMSVEVVNICTSFAQSINNPFQSFKYIDIVVRAVFLKLVNLSSLNQIHIMTVYYDQFVIALEYFSTSNAENFSTWKKSKLYYLSACLMRALTSIVKHCCQHYVEPCGEGRDVSNQLYNIEVKKKLPVELQRTDKIESGSGHQLLQMCLRSAFSKLLTAAQSITVIVWMEWLEMEEFTDENVQSLVGNDVYRCLQLIESDQIKEFMNAHLHSQLTSVLSNLSIKPANEDDEIKSADLETILNAINDPSKTRTKWVNALIASNIFVADRNSLNVIKNNIHLVDGKSAKILVEECLSFLKQEQNDDMEVRDMFKEVVLASLGNFHVDNQIAILEAFLKAHGLTDILKRDQFDSHLTEIFNRVVDTNTETIDVYTDLIRLSLQSPLAVIRKLIKVALSSTQNDKALLKLLKIISPICVYKEDGSDKDVLFNVVEVIVQEMEDLCESERGNFTSLIVKLASKSFINGDTFLRDCLMPKLYNSLQLGNFPVVLQSLEILQHLIDALVTENGNGGLMLPAYVVFLCQLIDTTRGCLSTFNLEAVDVCDKAVHVLITVLELFDPDEQHCVAMNWMKSELTKLSVITQMLVYSYVSWPTLGDHVSKKSIEVYWLRVMLCVNDHCDVSFLFDMRRDSFLRTLAKVLPLLTAREWRIMFTELVRKDDAHSLLALALAVLDATLLVQEAVLPQLSPSPDAESVTASRCLSHSLKNILQVIQDVVLPTAENLSGPRLMELFVKICYVLHGLPGTLEKNNSPWVLLKLLQNFVDAYAKIQSLSLSSEPPKVPEINKLFAAVSLIRNAQVRQHLSKYILSLSPQIKHTISTTA